MQKESLPVYIAHYWEIFAFNNNSYKVTDDEPAQIY